MEVTVKLLNNAKEYIIETENTTFLDLAKMSGYADVAYLAHVGSKIKELNKPIGKPCEIRFIGIKDDLGFEAYRRSLIFIMVKSFYDVLDNNCDERLFIDNVVGDGFYCCVKCVNGKKHSTKRLTALMNSIEKRMQELVDEDAEFKKEFFTMGKAFELFNNFGMDDKERLFHYRRTAGTNLYRIHRFYNYFYGHMLPSTGYLKKFKLHQKDQGFILQCPNMSDEMSEFCLPEKLFNVFKVTNEWNEAQGISTVADLNDMVCNGNGNIDELIQVQESYHDKQLATIADMIVSKKNIKFVMIAGPSSSGKTTFSKRLNIQLLAHMVKPIYLGIDNYFKDREHTPRDKDGNYDFESLDAIEIELFNEHMKALLDGKRVELPTYNFVTGKKEYLGNAVQLDDNQILVIEGIHGLNDELSYSIDSARKFKIYISALTQLNLDEHNRISTSDVRLLRRMIRDSRTRGASATQTIDMWSSVRSGENKYIFPYQEEADVMFNSSLIYELSVLKVYAEPLLYGIKRNDSAYIQASRLLKFLSYFVGIASDRVPRTSLIREFVGNGFFE